MDNVKNNSVFYCENVKLSPVYSVDYVKSTIFACVINKLRYG